MAIGVDRRPEEAALIDDLGQEARAERASPRPGPSGRGRRRRPRRGPAGGDATWRSGCGAAGADVVQRGLLLRPRRRGARPGRRVGLGQDHRGPGAARPRPPRAADHRAARSCLDGTDLLRAEPARPAGSARRAGRLRAPGPVGRAQPGAADRHPAARGAAGPPGTSSTTPAAAWPRCCARSRLDPTPGSCAATRTSSPAASSSGSPWRWRSRCRPSLIVLDEPTTGLDVTTQRHVLETVRSLCRSYGVAAVYVSHDLAVVSGLVVRRRGHVRRPDRRARGHGPASSARPVHPYTRGLLARRAVARPRRGADRDRGPAAAARPARRRLLVRRRAAATRSTPARRGRRNR